MYIYVYYFPIVSYLFTAIMFSLICRQLRFPETRLSFLHSDFLCCDPCVIFLIPNISLNKSKRSDEWPCCLICQGYKFVTAVSSQEGVIFNMVNRLPNFGSIESNHEHLNNIKTKSSLLIVLCPLSLCSFLLVLTLLQNVSSLFERNKRICHHISAPALSVPKCSLSPSES